MTAEKTAENARVARGTLTASAKPLTVLAEVNARWERPLGSDPRDPVPAGAPEVASEDVLVPRPDLGEGAHTLVLAGERLPARDELVAAPGPADRAKVLKSPKG